MLVKDFFAPSRRLLKCFNLNFLPYSSENKFELTHGSTLRQKGIQFRSGKWMEDVILLRCNNMRAFYIETIRCFTVLEKQSHNQKNVHRNTFIYFFLRGLYNLEKRNLLENTELAESDQYANKGFIGDYGINFQNRTVTTNIEQLRSFDVTPYKTMPFEQLQAEA